MGTNTGFRENKLTPTPPAFGGFAALGAFLRFFAVAVVAVLLVIPAVMRPGSSLAQETPQTSSTNKDSVVKEVVTLDSEIKTVNGRLGELENKSEMLQGKISGLDEEIAAKRRALAAKRKALADRARNMYVNGRSNKLIMLLSSDDVSEFFKRTEYLQKITQRDAELVDSIKQEAAGLESSLAELKRSKKEIDGVVSDLRSQKSRLVDRRAKREDLLARAGGQSGEAAQQSRRVEAKMEELNPPNPSGRHTGRFLTMVATAYSPQEPGLTDHTATGLKAQRGVCAVDPSVIHLGTRLHIEGYGYAIAADTGSAIKGNRIDLCFDTLAECNAYGRRTVRVEILD